jgi:hypothetical protein
MGSLVVLGKRSGGLQVVDRCDMELVEKGVNMARIAVRYCAY